MAGESGEWGWDLVDVDELTTPLSCDEMKG